MTTSTTNQATLLRNAGAPGYHITGLVNRYGADFNWGDALEGTYNAYGTWVFRTVTLDILNNAAVALGTPTFDNLDTAKQHFVGALSGRNKDTVRAALIAAGRGSRSTATTGAPVVSNPHVTNAMASAQVEPVSGSRTLLLIGDLSNLDGAELMDSAREEGFSSITIALDASAANLIGSVNGVRCYGTPDEGTVELLRVAFKADKTVTFHE